MKTIRGGGLLLVVVGGFAVLIWWARFKTGQPDAPVIIHLPDKVGATAPDIATNVSQKTTVFTNRAVVRASEFGDAERAAFSAKFQNKFKPAVERWCAAYGGHVPFNPEDVTMEKFHSRLGKNLYTFMVDGVTLTVQEAGDFAKVFYMAQGMRLETLNSIKRNGDAPPDISLPVNREEILRMVKADTGHEFKPNECVIKPTGGSSALAGGAFVEMLPAGSDPENGLSSKLDFVFGPDGKIVNYQRDPLF